MRKFSQINESNTTVQLSTNKKDFIKNLINESLSVENGTIKGKETLAKTINKIIDINDSKTIIKVLESIKMRSFHTLNLEWINEAIVAEKKKCNEKECEKEEDCECDDDCDEKEEKKDKKEKLNESVQDDVQAQFDEIPEEVQDEVQEEEIQDEVQEEIEEEGSDIKDELEEIKELELEILDKLDGEKSPADDFEDPIEDEEVQDEIEEIQDEEECEECDEIEDMFVEESTSYLKDINDLRLIMESINSGLITEDHIEDKKGQLSFIISKLTDKKLEKVILEKISKLPSYVKTADIEETLTNLSDKEVKDLYLAVEKAK